MAQLAVGYLSPPSGPIKGPGFDMIGILPFQKDDDLQNTTPEVGNNHKYALTQMVGGTPITWPSPERAYHGQKLLHLLDKFTNSPEADPLKRAAVIDMINDLTTRQPRNGTFFHPRDDWRDSMVPQYLGRLGFQTADEFNDACGAKDRATADGFMQTVIELRYNSPTNPEFREKLQAALEAGVLPVEVADDKTWGGGTDGDGWNCLGRIQAKVCIAHMQPPAVSKILDPDAAYTALQAANPGFLACASLRPYANGPNLLTAFPQPFASSQRQASQASPGSHNMQAMQAQQTQVAARRSIQNVAQTASESPAALAIASVIKSQFSVREGVQVCPGMQQGTMKLAFDSPDEAKAFFEANRGKYKLTYHGGDSSPPKDDRFGPKGKYVVRFERKSDEDNNFAPLDAMRFLSDKGDTSSPTLNPSSLVDNLKSLMKPWTSRTDPLNYAIGQLNEEQKKSIEAIRKVLSLEELPARGKGIEILTECAARLISTDPMGPAELRKRLSDANVTAVEAIVAEVESIPKQGMQLKTP